MKPHKVILAVFFLIVICVGVLVWFSLPHFISYACYEQIRPGMTLKEVEALIGWPGREIDQHEMHGVVDESVPVGSPNRVRPVVRGDKFYKWEKNGSQIIISIKGGVVFEKDYWYPAL